MARTKFAAFQYDSRFQDLASGKGVGNDEIRAELEYRDQALENYISSLVKQLSLEHGQGGRPIYADLAERDADPRTKLDGQTCYVIDTDIEYVWTGTVWRAHLYPVLYDIAPTITLLQQSSNLSYTVVGSMYRFSAGWLDVVINLAITSAGSSGTGISLRTNLTVVESTIQNTDIGTFRYFDSGTSNYVGVCLMDNAGTITFVQDGAGAILGAAFAAASGDSLQVRLRYPVDL